MGAQSIGIMVCALMFVACGTPKAAKPRVEGRTSVAVHERAALSLVDRERIDVCAGALIGLRGLAEDLHQEVTSTRARALVWNAEREVYLGGTRKHQVDWNPALDHLVGVLGDVDLSISSALALAATAHAEPASTRVGELEEAVERSGQTLRVVAVYLAGIRAAQYALHEAPAWVVGGLGFNDGLIERLDVLHGRLEALRAAGDLGRLKPEIDQASQETTAYIESYFQGLKNGSKLMEVAHVVSTVTGAVGMTQALAATARLLAGFAVESGGLTLSLAGAGSVASGAATEASTQGIVKGLAVATAGGTVSFQRSGGAGPVNVGLDGERRVGLSGAKERIPSVTGTAKYRIPDKITKLTLEEVKNVLRLSRTRQLLDYIEYCRKTRRTLVLWIRPTTKLAKPLNDLILSGGLRVEFIP